MKVLFLPKEGHPLKRVRLTELFMREFVSLGNEIDWVLTSFENERSNIHVPFGGGLLSNLILPFYRMKKLRISEKILRKEKPDIIIANDGIIEGLIASRLSRKYDIPFCYYLSSLFTDMEKNEFLAGGKPKNLVKWLAMVIKEPLRTRVIKRCNVFHPISDAMGRPFIKICTGIIHPLPLCPSHIFLETEVGSTSDFDIGIELVYTGQVTPNRKIELLLEIVKALKEGTDKNVNLTIVGRIFYSSYERFLKKKMAQLGIEDHVEIIPEVPISRIPAIIRKSNIGLCLLPPIRSFIVSSPTKVVEYLSLGIPVVANKEIEDQKVIIQNSKGGFSPAYDKKEIVDSILALVGEADMAVEMGLKGRRWIQENRNYQKMAVELDSLYNGIIGDRP